MVQSQIDSLSETSCKCNHNFGYGIADISEESPMQARNPVREPRQARALRDAGPLPPADLSAMRAALVAALGQGAAMIETPLIGRVEFRHGRRNPDGHRVDR